MLAVYCSFSTIIVWDASYSKLMAPELSRGLVVDAISMGDMSICEEFSQQSLFVAWLFGWLVVWLKDQVYSVAAAGCWVSHLLVTVNTKIINQ